MAWNIGGPPSGLDAKSMGAFDLAGALHSGLQNYGAFEEARFKPHTLAEQLLSAQLENKVKGVQAKYAEQMAQAQLAHQNALVDKARRGPAPVMNNLEKALEGTKRIIQKYGENSPEAQQAKAYVQRISQGSNGVTVGVDPDTGLPLVQIGGSGGRGSPGGKLYQTQNGEILAQPTGAQATNLQGRVVGAETVEPFINEVAETLPQFQNPKTKATSFAQGLSNAFLGSNYSLPSQQASGKAALKEASEGMLKSFGLNATGANREAMEEILTPTFGESPEGYKQRVTQQAEAFAKNKDYAKKSLRRGVSIGEGDKRLKYNPQTGRLE